MYKIRTMTKSDKVVDRDGNDLGHLYTLKEDGIYEGEHCYSMENTEIYTASKTSVQPKARNSLKKHRNCRKYQSN